MAVLTVELVRPVISRDNFIEVCCELYTIPTDLSYNTFKMYLPEIALQILLRISNTWTCFDPYEETFWIHFTVLLLPSDDMIQIENCS